MVGVQWKVVGQSEMSEVAAANWRGSGLECLGIACDEWTSEASNQALRYSTHGLFRYFGKFPPPVARQLICEYTEPGETVLDPMIGCGTTAVEALLLGRHCAGMDVNPLALLLTRVKCRRVPEAGARDALASLLLRAAKTHRKTPPDAGLWPQSIRTLHWFLPETCHWLQILRECIDEIESQRQRELFRVAYAGIIRRVSRATTEQGRLFLDAETAEPDPRPRFEAAAEQAIRLTSSLPSHQFQLDLREGSCAGQDLSDLAVPLIICHPPYFNLYRYSSVTALESAWLGYDIRAIQKKEIREFFKVGKPQNVTRYVEDMQAALRNISRALRPGGVLALMAGDTAIHGRRIQTTRLLIEAVQGFLMPFRVSIRTPRFTEASWAASQRRTGEKVGVGMADFVVHFRKAG